MLCDSFPLSVASEMFRSDHDDAGVDKVNNCDKESVLQSAIGPCKRPNCNVIDTQDDSYHSPTAISVCTTGVTASRALPDNSVHSTHSEIIAGDVPPKRRKISGGFRGVFAASRLDWCTLLQSGRILVREKGRKRCADVAIGFLFRDDNTHLLSWGSIRIPKDGELVSFPGMYRRI